MVGDGAGGTEGDATGVRAGDGTRVADVKFVIVAAVAENGVIGVEGGMPWHYPRDLAHFKRLTSGHPVVVGRTTYESIADRIGGPLPDRTSVVLTTRDPQFPDDVVAAGDVDEAVERASAAAVERDVDAVYVIGGATVYREFLPIADRLVITEVPERPEGDTRFPDRDRDEWTEVARDVDGNLAFVTYRREK